ncbi:MAG: GNAT family N-acetyltransferase [Patescibacteria group bacterium]
MPKKSSKAGKIKIASDLRQSPAWTRYLSALGWQTEEVKSRNGRAQAYIRKIPLLGTVIKIQRPSSIPDLKEVDQLAKKHHALLIKLEPALNAPIPNLDRAGYQKDPNPNSPTRTINLALDKPQRVLWENLSKDSRQTLRRTGSKLISKNFNFGEPGFDVALGKFHHLLQESGKRGGFSATPIEELAAKCKAFGKHARVFLVSQPKAGRPVAGALVLEWQETAYYHHTASSEEGLQLHAPYFMMWEIIKFFKRRPIPIRFLDFEGIYDSRYQKTTKGWQGFTVFKRKWGGEEISYPAPLIKFYNLPTKLLFKLGNLF